MEGGQVVAEDLLENLWSWPKTLMHSRAEEFPKITKLGSLQPLPNTLYTNCRVAMTNTQLSYSVLRRKSLPFLVRCRKQRQ